MRDVFRIDITSEKRGPMKPILLSHDDRFVEAYHRALSIVGAKNHDYSSDEDPFSNFRECEGFGVPAAWGVMVRLSDKFARLKNFFRKGTLLVRDESVEDTLIDIMNYAAILYALLKEEKTANKGEAL